MTAATIHAKCSIAARRLRPLVQAPPARCRQFWEPVCQAPAARRRAWNLIVPVRVQRTLLITLALLAAGVDSSLARVNPCAQERFRQLRCPDLVMKRPTSVQIDRYEGRLRLRSTSSIDSVGAGPIEILGRRYAAGHMRVRQRIYRRGGGSILATTSAGLVFKAIPGQGGYWKLRDAARMELWSVNAAGVQLRRVRVSPKLAYCLRDLKRTLPGLRGSPSKEVYPSCNQDRSIAGVRLGTSVGWSDIYPAGYYEQYIDVTGLRGRFALVHIVDPESVLFERDETNNASRVLIKLPSGERAVKKN
jgi:hypothetical protein